MRAIAIALLLLPAPLLGQKKPVQVPEIPPVEVAAVVTDASNAPIHGLSASDFHLFEDDKEQTGVGLMPFAGAPAPEPKPIALLIGPQTLENRKWIQQAGSKLAAIAGPAHPFVIVFTDACYNTSVTPVSSDPGQVKQMLEQWPDSPPCERPSDFGELAAAAFYAQVGETLGTILGHKTAILFVPSVRGTTPAEQMPAEASPARHGRGRDGKTPEPQHDPFDMKHEFRKADASVYPLQVQTGGAIPEWALKLSSATGGRPLSRERDGPDPLDRIAGELAETYSLVFRPRISAEGSCHELKVAVNRPDAKVFGRNLYCNVPTVIPAATANAAAAKPDNVGKLAGAGAAGNTDASLSIPFFYEPDGMARVNLALDVPTPHLEPIDRSGEVHTQLDLLGTAYIPGGDIVARFTHKCSFDFDTREQFDAFLRHPLHCEYQFKVAPGKYEFKLVFRSSKDHYGTVEAPLAIDPPRKDRLGLSSIALSRDVQALSPEAAQDAADRGEEPLVFRGNRIAVSGADVLPRSGTAEAYFEVYPPLSAGTAAPRLTMHLRLLDEATNTERWNSGDFDLSKLAKPGDRVVAVAVRLPAAKLPAGNYRAELTVTDGAGAGASRSIDFRTE